LLSLRFYPRLGGLQIIFCHDFGSRCFRIITASPCFAGSLISFLAGFGFNFTPCGFVLAALQAAHKAINLAGRIDDALLTCVIGMAAAAHMVRISGIVLPVVQVAPQEQITFAFG